MKKSGGIISIIAGGVAILTGVAALVGGILTLYSLKKEQY